MGIPFNEAMKKKLFTQSEPVMDGGSHGYDSDVDVSATKTAIQKKQRPQNMLKSSKAVALATAARNAADQSSKMTEEERELFESLGILDLVKEDTTSTTLSSSSSDDLQVNQKQKSIQTSDTDTPLLQEPASSKSSIHTNKISVWSRIRNSVFHRTPTLNRGQLDNPGIDIIDTRQNIVVSEISQAETPLLDGSFRQKADTEYTTEAESKYNPILLGIGGVAFLLPHLAVLLSLPPVLLQRGAPYLPTFGNKLNTMFDLIRNHTLHSQYLKQKHIQQSLKFVDLGSGDGRVVFRAAREGIFSKSVGYEINPALHLIAGTRKLVTPKYWSNTNFYVRDLWKIQLHSYDVVAVYGLSPIMEKLGKKLKEELKPGSIVVSNVFEIPGWRVCTKTDIDGGIDNKQKMSSTTGQGVFLYRIPDCFGKTKNEKEGTS